MRGGLDRLVGLVREEEAGSGGGGAAAGVAPATVATVAADGTATIARAVGGEQAGAGGSDQGGAPTAGAITPAQLAALREQAVALNPNVIPELITGNTVEEFAASLGRAREAFDRVANGVRAEVAGSLPQGGGVREVDRSAFESLSPEGKITFALSHQPSRG